MAQIRRISGPVILLAAPLAVLLSGSGAGFAQSAAERLDVIASAATAPVEASRAGRRAIRLPALTYRFQLRHACAVPARPMSLSLAVADSRQTIAGDDLAAANGIARLRLELPAGQIAPVAVDDFCVANAPRERRAAALTLPALLSASASLRCVDDARVTVTWATVPLDVVLVCRGPGPPS